MRNVELSELEEGDGQRSSEFWVLSLRLIRKPRRTREAGEVRGDAELGMRNGEWGIVGVGFDLTISEHSSFQIPHLTFDRSS